jgi:hypothetical protein
LNTLLLRFTMHAFDIHIRPYLHQASPHLPRSSPGSPLKIPALLITHIQTIIIPIHYIPSTPPSSDSKTIKDA